MVFQNDILAGSSGGTGTSSAVHTIGQSIRFNSGDSAYMHRTPSSTGNRKTFTSSFWFKRGKLGTDMYLGGPNISNSGYAYGIYFASDDSIYVWIYYSGSAWQGQLYTNRLFRDPSAWYHIVLSVDTTQAVSSERVRIYVNGQRETSFATENYPNQNQDTSWNVSGTQMSIGSGDTNPSASGAFFDGYLAEIHYLDGYAYDPSYFGLFNDSGIWIPKEYSGSYGTNGFHIKGEDSADLGNDSSGNNNDFTTSGLASDDQRSDSPTNNFATFNPLVASSDTFTYSNGNLKSLSDTNSFAYTGLTQAIKTGKYVIEFDVGTLQSSSSVGVGMCTLDYFTSNQASTTQDDLGQQSNSFLFRDNTGNDATRMFIESSSAITTNSPTLGNNDKFFIYVDADNGKAWVGLYDDSAGTTSIYGSDFDTVGNPATGANPTLSFTSGTEMMIFVQYYTGTGLTIETEPSKMTHSVVSGYNAINTKNLGS